jgi:hypothetical protein
LLQQGRVQVDADWNEEESGPIQDGQAFRIFQFSFDQDAVRVAVGSGVVGGLAVGTEPGGTFEGDQGLSLVVTPGTAITAFGAEIAFAPFDDTVAEGVIRLVVDCPDPPCVSVGNLASLSPRGGTFFLGVVANPGFAFNRVTLEAVTPRDDSGEPIGVVPGWQIAGITFAPVPEPGTSILIAAGLCCLALVRSRVSRSRSGRGRVLAQAAGHRVQTPSGSQALTSSSSASVGATVSRTSGATRSRKPVAARNCSTFWPG